MLHRNSSWLYALTTAALIAAPSASNALTVTLEDTSTGATLTIDDNGANDTAGNSDVIVSSSPLTVGGFTISNISAQAFDDPTSSELSQTALSVSGGAAGATLRVTTSASFSGGAASPDASGVMFSLGGSQLGGSIEGYGSADGTQTATISFDPTADGTDSFQGTTRMSAVLGDPFDLASVVTVGQIDQARGTQFTATVMAAIPVPAGGALLLAGLGGLFLARRRRCTS